MTFDTATLTDGVHEVSLDVRDVTDDNKAIHGPWTITVDNLPPGITTPSLTGRGRDGDTITCAAGISGQDPTVTYQWLRTAPDGSDPQNIPTATNAAYTVTDADVGHKLICRVTASDGGGTKSMESSITQPPFDGGKTVVSYCTERPAGPADECGDLDGDRLPNRSDDDIDGDGVINVGDSSPYDPAVPSDGTAAPNPTPAPNNSSSANTTSTTTTSQTNTSQTNTSQTTEPSTLGAAGTVKFLLGRETATFIGRRSRWLKSAFTLRGRLTGVDGRAIGGLKLFISQTVAGRSVSLGSTTSSPDGSWSYRVPRGPGRTITVAAGDGINAATMTVTQRVIAHVTLTATRKRVRSGGLARFTGRLRGGYTNSREKLVEFQVYYRRSWRTIGTLRVNRDGKFTVRYRFGTAAYGRYKFRARSMPTDGYPFTPGVSKTSSSVVRVG